MDLILFGLVGLAALVLWVRVLALQDRYAALGLSGWGKLQIGLALFVGGALYIILQRALGLTELLTLFGLPIGLLGVASAWAVGLFLIFSSPVRWLSALRARQEQTATREDELSLLESIREAAWQPYTLVEILQYALKEMLRFSGVEAGIIFVANLTRKELILAAASGLSREQMKRFEKIALGGDLFSRSFTNRKPVLIGNLSLHERATRGLLQKNEFRSLACVPLLVKDGVVGAGLFLSPREFALDQKQVASLAQAGNLLGSAIETARLQREVARRTERVGQLEEGYKSITDLISFVWQAAGWEQAFDRLFVALLPRLGGEVACVVQKESGDAYRVIASSDPTCFGKELGSPFTPHFAEAVRTGRPLVVPGLLDTPLGDRIASAVIAPLFFWGESQGFLVIGSARPDPDYSQAELAQMDFAARLAAVAATQITAQRAVVTTEDKIASLSDSAAALLDSPGEKFWPEVVRQCERLIPKAGAVLVFQEARPGQLALRFANVAGTLPEVELAPREGSWSKALAEHRPYLATAPGEVARLWSDLSPETRTRLAGIIGARTVTAEITLPLAAGRRLVADSTLRDSPSGTAGAVLSLLTLSETTRTGEPTPPFSAVDFHLAKAFACIVSALWVRFSAPAAAGAPITGDLAAALNDFNNLLTSVLGNAQMLHAQVDHVPGESRQIFSERLEHIAQAAGAAGDLLRSLPSAGSAAGLPSEAAVDLTALVRETLTKERTESLESGSIFAPGRAAIHPELSSVPPVTLDPGKFKAFLGEIFKRIASRPGESVTVKTDADQKYVYLRLWQKGEPPAAFGGVPSQSMEAGTARDVPVDLDLVRSFRGEASYIEDETSGRALVLRFPIARAAEKSEAEHPARTLSILAIDDQPLIRDLLVAMGANLGHTVRVAESGPAGVALFRQQRFDLVITDLSMPGASGWEVSRTLKKIAPDVPIVLVTGWGHSVEGLDLKALGIDYVLPKPFRLEQFAELVAQVAAQTAS